MIFSFLSNKTNWEITQSNLEHGLKLNKPTSKTLEKTVEYNALVTGNPHPPPPHPRETWGICGDL